MDECQLRNFLKFAPSRFGFAPRKHLFIHIPKNGGMAIRQLPEVQGRLVIANRWRLISKDYANSLKEHMLSKGGASSAYERARYRDADLTVRKASRAFAIVRNPWARTVSRFKFALQTRKKGAGKGGYGKSAFERFLEERHAYGNEPYYWHRAIRSWCPQSDYVVDEIGRIAVDILRQEALGHELKSYLGLSVTPERRNVSTTSAADYRELFTPETIRMVADWYAGDIDTFGFDFDTGATRNAFYDAGAV